VVAKVNLSGQTAPISATTIYTAPASQSGMYRITVSLITRTVGSGGACIAAIATQNGAAKTWQSTNSINLTMNGSEVSTAFVGNVLAAGAIEYSTSMPGATGAPAYQLGVTVEYLGQQA
jgi:hypothetical protein